MLSWSIMYDIFVSYSRADLPLPDEIVRGLVQQSVPGQANKKIMVWFDQDAIEPASEFRTRIQRGIEQARAVMLICSEAYLASEICYMEMAYAHQLGKPLIPVLLPEAIYWSQVDTLQEQRFREKGEWQNTPRSAPKQLFDKLYHSLNFIQAHRLAFETLLEQIIQAAFTDLAYHDQLRRWTTRTLEWQQAGQRPGKLLSGDDLHEAEGWRDHAILQQHPVEKFILDYIALSRMQQQAVHRRRRFLISTTALAFALMLLVATGLFFQSENNQRIGDTRGTAVIQQEATALDQTRQTESLRLLREANTLLESPTGNLETAALLAVRAYQLSHTAAARDMLREILPQLHTGQALAVTAPAFAAHPDGKHLYVAVDNTQIALLNIETQAILRHYPLPASFPGQIQRMQLAQDGSLFLRGTNHQIYVLNTQEQSPATLWLQGYSFFTLSPDQQWMALSNQDTGGLTLYHLPTGEQTSLLPAAEETLLSVDAHFSSDSQQLVFSQGHQVRLLQHEGNSFELAQQWETEQLLMSVAFAPDDQAVVLSYLAPAKIEIIELATQARRLLIDFPTEAILAQSRFSLDGQLLLTQLGWRDGTTDLRLFDAQTGEEVQRLSGHTGAITQMGFSLDGQQVISASADGGVRFWPIRVKTVGDRPTLAELNALVLGIRASSDGQHLLTATASISLPTQGDLFEEAQMEALWLSAWETESGQMRGQFDLITEPLQANNRRLETISTALLETLTFSPDGQWVAWGNDSQFNLWNVTTGEAITPLPLAAPLSTIRFSPEQPSVQVYTTAGLTLWSLPAGKLTATVEDAVWLSADEQIAMLLKKETALHLSLIEHLTGREIWRMAVAEGVRYAVSPDERQLVLHTPVPGTRQTRLSFFERASGELQRHLILEHQPTGQLIFSPDSRYLLVEGGEHTYHEVFDLTTLTSVQQFAPSYRLDDVNNPFSADGAYITLTDNSGLYVWQLTTGEIIAQLPVDTFATYTSVAIAPESQLFAGTMEVDPGQLQFNGRVVTLEFDEENLIRQGCSRIFRDLTVEERTRYGVDETPTCP